jgi:undecaprenyl-phosphate 4-deoxy-4-formamido-L-arabinose transferase
MTSAHVKVSLVIPVYNEEESLPALFRRLTPVLEGLGRSCEVLFVNDGSRDRSLAFLLAYRDRHPTTVRGVDFNGNFGQHMAILAGFEKSRGDFVITMAADLQNPPEEIPRLVALLEAGHDVVGTYRVDRQDPLFRKVASRMVNGITNRITGLGLRDYGCMLGDMRGASWTTSTPVRRRRLSFPPWRRNSPSIPRKYPWITRSATPGPPNTASTASFG